MIQKEITWFGKQAILACDAKCEKAWGINNRPKVSFDPDDPDDYALLADSELGISPADPGVYEGEHAKPKSDSERLNKWCARECERSEIVNIGETIVVRDFSQRRYNQRWKHSKEISLQDAVAKVKQLAKDMNIKILWAHEPGDAARKRREEEDLRDSIS